MLHIEKRDILATNARRYPYTALAGNSKTLTRFYIRRGEAEGWVAQAGVAGIPCGIDHTGARLFGRTLRELDAKLAEFSKK